MANKYAVVFTSDFGYMENATALTNGLLMYDNDVDIHPVLTSCVPDGYKEVLAAHPNIVVPKWGDIPPDPSKVAKMGKPRAVRFFRYLYASQIAKDYKAILIVDSDSFIAANIMEQFKLAEESKELVMVRNHLGITPPEIATLNNVTNSVHPPYHCTGSFWNCERFAGLLRETFENSFKEGHSDMAGLFRTIMRSGYPIKNIHALKNYLWCWTRFNKGIAHKTFDEQGRWVLTHYHTQKDLDEGQNGERICLVHGRWSMEKWIHHHAPGLLKEPFPKNPTPIQNNLKNFWDIIKWLNKEGPIQWDWSERHHLN